MSKVNEAVEVFQNGSNCSQAIFSTYCEQLGFTDKESALRIACGFGGGMGRLGETCGAVTGAYMLIGLKYGQALPNDKDAKEKTYELVQEFARRFEQRNKTTSCKGLLGVDLITGDKSFASQRVKAVCPKAVKDSAEIIEEILELA